MTPGRREELRQLEPAPVPGAFDLTVVVPTRNERDNIAPLLRRLERVRPELRLEVLFVDDSTDDTPRAPGSPRTAGQAIRRCSPLR